MKEADLEEPPDTTDPVRQRGHHLEGLVGIQIIIPTYDNCGLSSGNNGEFPREEQSCIKYREMRTNCRKKVEPKMGQRKRGLLKGNSTKFHEKKRRWKRISHRDKKRLYKKTGHKLLQDDPKDRKNKTGRFRLCKAD